LPLYRRRTMTIGEGRTAFDRLPTVVNVIELLLRSTFDYLR